MQVPIEEEDGEENNLLGLLGLEPQTIQSTAQSLYWLHYRGSKL